MFFHLILPIKTINSKTGVKKRMRSLFHSICLVDVVFTTSWIENKG